MERKNEQEAKGSDNPGAAFLPLCPERVHIVTIARILISVLVLLPLPSFAEKLSILTENLPNLNYLENGRLVGYSVDIVKEIQRRVGSTDEIEVFPWARAYNMALREENTILFSVTFTEERKDLFKWVCPLVTKRDILVGLKTSDLSISSIEDAKRVTRIGTIRGDSKEQLLMSLGFENLESVSSERQNVRKLVLGRIDLWANKQPGLKATCEQAGIEYDLVEEVLHLRERELCIAFSKFTSNSIVLEWRNTFVNMMEDGTINNIRRKWGFE
jgi:polar amino acid transport system substrate-binding protein